MTAYGRVKNISVIILTFALSLLTGCSDKGTDGTVAKTGEMDLSYATGFSVEYYEGGYEHIAIGDEDYVLIPDGKEPVDLGFSGATLIRMPVHDIYLAASSAMDMFVTLDEIDRIATCSTSAADYSIPEAKEAITDGRISYIGKYSAPDYEQLVASGSGLAIESTMITHSPDIKEEIERLGIPVMVERSSYESSPLGRLEWIKLYGALLGREDEAAGFFEGETKALDGMLRGMEDDPAARPVVAFFYISSNGYVNVRKPGDYISQMIAMAQGEYFLSDDVITEENALSTMNINWEDFYTAAVDADIIIYNATIDGGLNTREDLIAKNELFSDFKAVREDRVYCTTANMFQESCGIAEVISDIHKVIRDETSDGLYYLYKVE